MNHAATGHTFAESSAQLVLERVKSALARLGVGTAEALPPAIAAERKTMRTHQGHVVSFYEDKKVQGRPVLLIHSVNACASAYEMKPLFEALRQRRPVFALDLPGFGFSDRDNREYTPELYEKELVDVLGRVHDAGGPADVVALSLGCEFAARAALRRKDLVHTLAFISPTGLGGSKSPIAKRAFEAVANIASHDVAGLLAYGALTAKPSIHHYLKKSFVRHADPGIEAYAYATSHQPGARYAPLAFLRQDLFTKDIRDTYAALDRPVVALYGGDGYTTFDKLPELVASSPRWSERHIPGTRGMPQFDALGATQAALEAFWNANKSHHRA